MKPRIHYHTHAGFFSGAENMIALFLQSNDLNAQFSLTFSYVYSKVYEEGFRRRVRNFSNACYALHFFNLYSLDQLPLWVPVRLRRIVFAIFNSVILYPLFIYEVIVLGRLFRKIRPDILHVNNAGYPAALSARAAVVAGRWCGISKIVMVVNNMAAGYSAYSRWIEYPLDKVVAYSADAFITGSLAAALRLKEVLRLPFNKLFAIHNGIVLREPSESLVDSRSRFGLTEFNGVIFGVVALLVPRKGHQILLNSVLKLITEKRNFSNEFVVLIEGDGPLLQALLDFVTVNDLAKWIIFVGKEANIVDFMSLIDVLILPSILDEDFPNVILEAMALGKPVISSRLAGTPEQVVHGVTGLLVEPRDVVQLADAIIELSENNRLRFDMGQAGSMRYTQHFTGDIAVAKYLNFYTQLITNSR